MATIQFQFIKGSIYVNFSNGRNSKFRRKTGFTTTAEQWQQKKTKFSKSEKVNGKDLKKVNLESPTDDISKRLKSEKLDPLKKFIENQYNEDFSKGIPINADWLDLIIKKQTNQNAEEAEYLNYHIQKAIDNAPRKKVPTKGGKHRIGLSQGRIKGIIQFRNIIERFENEKYKGLKIKVSGISKDTINDFEDWLFAQKYSENYIGKQLANFKSILNEMKGIPININLKTDIVVINEDKEPDDVVYLSFEEIEKIKNLNLTADYLINARKWLVLGCYVGQRVSDLMELTPSKIKVLNGRKVFFIQQMKTKKKVTIPILPEAQEVLDSGFPRKISDTKLREYFKKLCELAELNTPTKGRIKEGKNGITKKGIFPKWKMIGTHVCRRSFASNYYGQIPTVVLMGITGHANEKTFLVYIGKSNEDFAMQMFDYVEKLPKTKTLRIVNDEQPTGTDNN